MKKINIIILTLLLVLGIIFYACKKDIKTVSNRKDVVKEFVEKLNFSKDKFQNKTIALMFTENPYDSVGIMHNYVLQLLNNNGSLGTNVYDALDFFADLFQQEYEADTFINFYNRLNPLIFNNDSSYNSDFINSLSNISEDEKDIVNNYFLILLASIDLDELIYLSQEAESYIIDSDNFTENEKERMLTTFALFRYSSFFWVNLNLQKLNFSFRTIMYSVADALAEYCAANCLCNVPCEEFQDGKDIHMFSGRMSTIAFYGGWGLKK